MLGLAIIIWVALPDSTTLGASFTAMAAPAEFGEWNGILLGGILAFYAYIGFEDMVNVAEEVRNPVKTMPLAFKSRLLIYRRNTTYIVAGLIDMSFGGQRADNQFAQHFI